MCQRVRKKTGLLFGALYHCSWAQTTTSHQDDPGPLGRAMPTESQKRQNQFKQFDYHLHLEFWNIETQSPRAAVYDHSYSVRTLN